MGLPKVNRLRKRSEFQQIYRQGSRYRGRYLILHVLKGLAENNNKQSQDYQNMSPSRLGISIGKKVSKKAVIRNRLKRQIRAAIRELLEQILPGWKIILVVRPGAQGCEYEQILQELKKLLKQAEVIHGHSREHFL